jgi:2-keto-4-pentenoate hydratase
MDRSAIAAAADMLVAARRTDKRAERFPEASRPATAAEAAEIQAAVVAALGETIAGWKVAEQPDFGLMHGALLASRLFRNNGSVAAALVPMLGVEAEIAFRFDRDLPPRQAAYDRADIESRVTALVGMEIVDSRFREPGAVPVIERAADCMSNGGFVVGTVRQDWRSFDLAGLEASLAVNGNRVVDRRVGGHVTKDPILLAIVLANVLRTTTGITAGQIVTTGTYTGLEHAKRGDRVEAIFEGFGKAEIRFE